MHGLTYLTNDGSHPYTYDTENRLLTAGGVTYTYDGDGKRVKKSNGTLYWTGPGWDPLLETDLSGNSTEEYVFFNGERVARVDLPANTVPQLPIRLFLTAGHTNPSKGWTLYVQDLFVSHSSFRIVLCRAWHPFIVAGRMRRRVFASTTSSAATPFDDHFGISQRRFDLTASRAAVSLRRGCPGHRELQCVCYLVGEWDCWRRRNKRDSLVQWQL
jgi:hypothetical protein